MAISAAERAAMVAERRPRYLADIEAGIERYFEPARPTCPWCGSSRLRPRLQTTDVLQHKPGRFLLDSCQTCEHIFQNPRLNSEGMEFYYRDFYDGLGEHRMSKRFSRKVDMYRSRAEAVKPHASPATWLDIGTGHGHFPKIAKEIFPETRFDGLDQSDGIELAVERGWVSRGYRSELADVVTEAAGSYDVVSMFHYLEHIPDPRRELELAAKLLRPGGHLVIEVPDPQCRWMRILGRWWLPWLQPQHLHFISMRNLANALGELGFSVRLQQRREAHMPLDLTWALWLVLDNALRGEDVPWEQGPPPAVRASARRAGLVAALPFFGLAGLADRAVAAVGAERGFSNAYRMVAAK